MARAMTKAKIVAALAVKVGIPKKTSAAYLDALAALAYKETRHGFSIPGIGKLMIGHSKARRGSNPRTGEAMKIRAKRRVRFRVSKLARDAIIGRRR